ncbi:MAG: DUF6435 family protein [Bacteroidia bacterium]
MFSLFKKDSLSDLEKQYHQKLKEARNYQSSEDVSTFSAIMYEANKLYSEIENQRHAQQMHAQYPEIMNPLR